MSQTGLERLATRFAETVVSPEPVVRTLRLGHPSPLALSMTALSALTTEPYRKIERAYETLEEGAEAV